jgi:hypothetical protein
METKMTVYELVESDFAANATLSETLFLTLDAAEDAGNQMVATLLDEGAENAPEEWQEFEDGTRVWTWRAYVLRIRPRPVLGF